ncbi:hypothetical protein [Aquidulcibacter sp.]|uniref:hypothetical protein n=1 Tax=Aquidulcibacter sp. TaxID=2052990 RepID=UPI0025BF0A17|nr:hypothetical protein [Aquidulcibacter sp.]MCA3064988.1 hypothetical protein [Rhodocyclaceae bacterium]MCA3694250.1 hypothetical protein [Aquidulcibacter sp.]
MSGSAQKETKVAKAASTDKPYAKIMFQGSSDPSATDPVYWAVNGEKFLAPREKELVVKYDAISHLMEPEFRPKAVYNPRTGGTHIINQKVAFNRPQILERLSVEDAQPYLQEQADAAKQERENLKLREAELAQE